MSGKFSTTNALPMGFLWFLGYLMNCPYGSATMATMASPLPRGKLGLLEEHSTALFEAVIQ